MSQPVLRPADRRPRRSCRIALPAALALAAMIPSGPCGAEPVEANAVLGASDAFGLSIGHEAIGLYDPGSIRGFSPAVAGNTRIKGLYYDDMSGLSSHVSDQTTLRVGLAAQDYAFPAPTGIVDISLRTATAQPQASGLAELGPWSSGGAEIDLAGPLPSSANTATVTGGASWYRNHFGNGGGSTSWSAGAAPRWQITPHVTLTGFVDLTGSLHETSQGVYEADGDVRPAGLPENRYPGPDWTRTDSSAGAAGAILTGEDGDWSGALGLFRSQYRSGAGFLNLFTLETPSLATRSVTAFPPGGSRATSGEARLARRWTLFGLTEVLTLMLRGRDEQTAYGSGDARDFGSTTVMSVLDTPQPVFHLQQTTREQVRQWTEGISLSIGRPGWAELTAGLLHTDDRRLVKTQGLADAAHRDDLWRPSVSAAVHPLPAVTLYGSRVLGLEDAGTAPNYALNAFQVLPANRTRQSDFGLRWALSDTASLLLGGFSVSKPSLALRPDGIYGRAGRETHHGIELSITAHPSAGLTLVTGAVLARPRVRPDAGEAAIGARPVGLPDTTWQVNVDYAPPVWAALSVDGTVSGTSHVAATLDGAVSLPGATTVETGFRYRLTTRGHTVTLRGQISNVTDVTRLIAIGSGVYVPGNGRRASVYLTTAW